MATCNVNELIAANRCFAALPPFMLQVVATQLWCDISGAITPPSGSGNEWWNPDVNAPIDNPDTNTPIVNPDA